MYNDFLTKKSSKITPLHSRHKRLSEIPKSIVKEKDRLFSLSSCTSLVNIALKKEVEQLTSELMNGTETSYIVKDEPNSEKRGLGISVYKREFRNQYKEKSLNNHKKPVKSKRGRPKGSKKNKETTNTYLESKKKPRTRKKILRKKKY